MNDLFDTIVKITTARNTINAAVADQEHCKSLGGPGDLRVDDMPEVRAGVKRVLEIMSDGNWYSNQELRDATGLEQADRRRRELSAMGYTIHKRRVGGSRHFVYRLGSQMNEEEVKRRFAQNRRKTAKANRRVDIAVQALNLIRRESNTVRCNRIARQALQALGVDVDAVVE